MRRNAGVISRLVSAVLLPMLLVGCAAARVDHRGHGPCAYVTNEADNSLMKVDLMAGKVVGTLSTGKTPHALIVTPSGKMYVNNRGEHSLTVVDIASFTVLGAIKLPAASIQFSLSPDHKTLAVGYKDALEITFIDTASDTILANVDIGPDQPGRKLVRIKHPFWSRDGRYLYAGDNLNLTVVKIDAASHRVAAVIPLHASVHHFIADPAGRYIYVCEGGNGRGGLGVSVLDPASDRIVRTIPVPLADGEKAKGHHGIFSPDGRFFYFCNEGGRTLAIVDTTALRLVKTIRVGKGAGHTFFSRDGKRAFVVCHHDNVVAVIDTATRRLVKMVPAGRGKKQGHSGFVGSDGIFYMLNAADGAIIRIDGNTLAPLPPIKVGRRPMIMVVR